MELDDAEFAAALNRGIELFENGRYLEAYEAWEERWNVEMSEGTDLLQGLLQVAVAFAKLERGNPQGTAKLLEQAKHKLMPYLPSAYGLDVQGLLAGLAEWRQMAEQMVERGVEGSVELPPAPRLGMSGSGEG